MIGCGAVTIDIHRHLPVDVVHRLKVGKKIREYVGYLLSPGHSGEQRVTKVGADGGIFGEEPLEVVTAVFFTSGALVIQVLLACRFSSQR